MYNVCITRKNKRYYLGSYATKLQANSVHEKFHGLPHSKFVAAYEREMKIHRIKFNHRYDLNYEIACKYFEYNSKTGIITRKLRTSNVNYVGDVAGNIDSNGYYLLGIGGF